MNNRNWYRVSRPLAYIDPDERGFQYGDGVFETVAIRNGEPRLWSRHLRRLERACERLGFERPPMVEPQSPHLPSLRFQRPSEYQLRSMTMAPQDGQNPRRLQENATRCS